MTAHARTTSRATATPAAEPPVNEVHLVGRLAAPPESRELPSGDLLVSFRLVVGRGPARARPAGSLGADPTVDTLDCAVWRADLQRRAARLDDGRRARAARQPPAAVLALRRGHSRQPQRGGGDSACGGVVTASQAAG